MPNVNEMFKAEFNNLDKKMNEIDSLIKGLDNAFAATEQVTILKPVKGVLTTEEIEEHYKVLEKIRIAMKEAFALKDKLGKVGDAIGVDNAGKYIERALSRFKIQEIAAWKALSRAAKKVLPSMLKENGDKMYDVVRKELPSNIQVVPDQYVALTKTEIFYGYYLYIYTNKPLKEYLTAGLATRVTRKNPDEPTELKYSSCTPPAFDMPNIVFKQGQSVSNGAEAGDMTVSAVKNVTELKKDIETQVGIQVKPTFEKMQNQILSKLKPLNPDVKIETELKENGLEVIVTSESKIDLNKFTFEGEAYQKAVKVAIQKMEHKGNPLPPGLVEDVLREALKPFKIDITFISESKKVKDINKVVTGHWSMIFMLTK